VARRRTDIAEKANLEGNSATEQAVRKAVLLILERIGIPSHYNLRKTKKSTSQVSI
jgi:hypothetical protein